MVQSSKNTLSSLNPTLVKVLDVLGVDKKAYKETGQGYRTDIHDIIENTPKARKNPQLAMLLIQTEGVDFCIKEMGRSVLDNRDVAFVAVKSDSSVFTRLNAKQQIDPQIAKEAIKSMVREKLSFLEVEKFLSERFPDKKVFQKLFGFYKTYLKTAEYLFHTDLERQLVAIKEKSDDLYQRVLGTKLIEQQGKKFVLSSQFQQTLHVKLATIPNYEELEPAEQEKILYDIFIEFLGIDQKQVTEDVLVFFQTLKGLIQIKKTRKQVTQADPAEDTNTDTSTDEEEDDLDEQEERMDYVLPYCSYTASDSSIQISAGDVKIGLSKDELDKINDLALQNYVKAAQLFAKVGLGFVLDYKHQFLRNICDVDYLYGEGLSEAKMLKVCNKIGKSIGVPEKKYYSEDDTEKQEEKTGCFQRVDEAVYHFKQIRDTGKVNDKQVIDPGKAAAGKSVMRYVFEEKELLDKEGTGFYRNKWDQEL